jgi:hypothetical protein
VTITLDLVRQVYLIHYEFETAVPLRALHALLAERGGFPELVYAAQRLAACDPNVELTVADDGGQALVVRPDVRGLTYAASRVPDRTLVFLDGALVGYVIRTPLGWSAWRQEDEAGPVDGVAFGQQTIVDAARQLIPQQRRPTP